MPTLRPLLSPKAQRCSGVIARSRALGQRARREASGVVSFPAVRAEEGSYHLRQETRNAGNAGESAATHSWGLKG